MDCFKLNIYDLTINESYLYPIICLFGLAMTYLGNKFVKPILFAGGTLVSSTSSYKVTEFILKETNHNNCDILYVITIITSLSGGYLFLKLYKYMNFILGFLAGGSIGYVTYISWFHHFRLGVYFIYDNTFWICVLTPGIITGIITYIKEKNLSVMLTSLIGPTLIVISTKELLEGTIKNLTFLNYFMYTLMYLFFSTTGFYVQYKRKHNEKEKINYQPQYKSFN